MQRRYVEARRGPRRMVTVGSARVRIILSFRNDRTARSIFAASELPEEITSSKARSAASFQCQVSSNASICVWLPSPVHALNSTLQVAFEFKGGSR